MGSWSLIPLGNVFHNLVHKNIFMFPYWDLLSFLCLILALINNRIYFSNAYRSSFKFLQQIYLLTPYINAWTVLLLFLSFEYLPICYINRGHFFLFSDFILLCWNRTTQSVSLVNIDFSSYQSCSSPLLNMFQFESIFLGYCRQKF